MEKIKNVTSADIPRLTGGYITVLFAVLLFFAVPKILAQESNKGWIVEVTGVGIYSSPRAADLNQDGIKDLIIGAGKLEFQEVDTAVVAVDGASGEMLWKVSARDQIFGSATLIDINQDGVSDVLIGGRSAELMAINGKTGQLIWEYFSQGDRIEPGDHGLYNFYNAQIIPDQTYDGLEDILVTNGGDVNAEPHESDRPPGKLMVIDSSNGQLLAKAEMSDGKETYMSAVVSTMHKKADEWTIIVGTGGETIGGSLYRTTLRDVMKEDISNAVRLDSSKKKGFIAPPVLCDITGDGYYDIIANVVEGRMVAFDGKTNERLWETNVENTEAYGSIAVGHFNDDLIPDFFTTYAKGVWPNLEKAKQIMVNGKTGAIEFRDSLGVVQTSSPVVADFNNDGFEDGLMSINFIQTTNVIEKHHFNMLVVYDFHNDQTYQLTKGLPGVNLSSTPWIGDLDGSGTLDIIYSSLTETQNIFAMNGFKIIRLPLNLELKSEIRWGAYMGSDYNGICKEE